MPPRAAALPAEAHSVVAGPDGSPSEPVAVTGRVSIVVPAYNCEATIADAVNSCLAQTYGDVEVIVVDDGSTDGTAQVLEQFGGRIRVLRQSNAGLAAARNAGSRAATGQFVAWMDADDLATPERLRVQVGVLASRPAIALVSSDFSAFFTGAPDFADSHIVAYYASVRRQGGVDRIYAHRDVIDPDRIVRDRPVLLRWGDIYVPLLHGNLVHPPTVMVRRGVFDTVGWFDESLRYSSDYDLILRVARTGLFAYIDAPLLRYRISAMQMSQTGGATIPLETVRILERIRRCDPLVHASVVSRS